MKIDIEDAVIWCTKIEPKQSVGTWYDKFPADYVSCHRRITPVIPLAILIDWLIEQGEERWANGKDKTSAAEPAIVCANKLSLFIQRGEQDVYYLVGKRTCPCTGTSPKTGPHQWHSYHDNSIHCSECDQIIQPTPEWYSLTQRGEGK